MAAGTTLLFLHGVGSGDRGDDWQRVLGSTLTSLGYPGLDGVAVVAPKYPDVLRAAGTKAPLPPVTIDDLTGSAARTHRRAVERRIAALEARLGRHDTGAGWVGADQVVDLGMAIGPFTQAHNYLTRPRVRAQVLTKVLDRLPRSGRLVVVGHSLGSVVAADLVRRLPVGLEVAGMVTIGSPLGHERFDVDGLRKRLAAPPANLSWWANFWNELDPVTSHRGVSAVVPWLLDRRVRAPALADPHASAGYLADTSVATAVGFALHGSLDHALAVPERGPDIALDPTETVALVALLHAHLVNDRLDGSRRQRHRDAIRTVQACAVEAAVARNRDHGVAVSQTVLDCHVDLLDPDSAPPRPRAMRHLSAEDAVVPLVFVATTNVIRPFEIAVPLDVRRAAMADLTSAMGLGSALGTDVHAALAEAHEVLGCGPSGWVARTALGMGTGALAAATGGLTFAAAPVGGAAAAVSALAPFEPDGILGELLSAAAFATSSSDALPEGLARARTSAETVLAVVETQLAAALLRQRRGLEQDSTTWRSLVLTGAEVRREQARLASVCDRSSDVLTQARRKLDAVDRAVRHLADEGLVPGPVTGWRGPRE